MAEIVSFGDTNPDKYKQSFREILWEKFSSLDRFTKLFIITGLLLIVSTPFIVRMVFTTTQQASGSELSSVQIQPADLKTQYNAQPIEMSVLAYDFNNQPIWENVLYEWTMSSQDSIGNLTKILGKENIFTPKRPGFGEITVTARLGNASISKTAPVRVGPIDELFLTKEFKPIADAYVKKSAPKLNFGKDTQLFIDENPKTNTYLKFDLNVLKGKSIQNAILTLHVGIGQNASSKGTSNVKVVSDTNWIENSINFNNRPFLSTLVASFSNPKKGEKISVDLTKYVITKAGSKFSIGIESLSGDDVILKSRESNLTPVLTVYYK